MIVCLAIAPSSAPATDPNEQQVVQDLGAVLAWRMGPEAIEEHCRSADPEGVDARKAALKSWLDKNDALIKAVDSRVAEVAPMLNPNAKGDAMEQAIRAQVKAMLLDDVFAEKGPNEVQGICKAEADPASPRWNNPGMPAVPESLAALYDWKTTRDKK